MKLHFMVPTTITWEDYVYRQKHTIDELLRNEVENGLKLMNKDGFFPTTFAYPYGAHNGVIGQSIDALL
ncbi:MAG: hypothetical protein WDM90_22760 [Ferruginibacter sp.]